MVNKKFKMKKIFSLFILITSIIHAQETEFTFTPEKGMTDYIVISVEGKTAPEIYKKVIEWIKINYKNPDKVILSTIENEYIRFEGIGENAFSYENMYGKGFKDIKYQIEIYIKDGKYKFDVIKYENWFSGNSSESASWYEIPEYKNNLTEERLKNIFYRKNGKPRETNKYFYENINYFNTLNKSLFESINSTVKKNDNW
ncbi:DUF4468 domain-containing protein [Flavobacterium sufflavum]|uniref:DUF4468 domain-containing protein n=2 Tax=Flavobacterium sufflavum TaxID=1921138 RepID=A0A437L0T6_9FLAO|nr:DUF4468 domain-containing protein [Flavobacterium sufflavum]